MKIGEICCFKCLMNYWSVFPAEHLHHIIYESENLQKIPLCKLCHSDITALNCETSRRNGYRTLTPDERVQNWFRFLKAKGNGPLVFGFSMTPWTDSCERIFNALENDRGFPPSDLKIRADRERLFECAQIVLRGVDPDSLSYDIDSEHLNEEQIIKISMTLGDYQKFKRAVLMASMGWAS